MTASIVTADTVQDEALWVQHDPSSLRLSAMFHHNTERGASGVRLALVLNIHPVPPVDGILHLGRLQARLRHQRVLDQHCSDYLLFFLFGVFLYPQNKNPQSFLLLSEFCFNLTKCLFVSTIIAVQRLYWNYLAGGGSQRPGDLPLQGLPQPGSQGGDLLQHGEVRDEQGQQSGRGPPSSWSWVSKPALNDR